jgi:hypothetical protein
MIEYEYVQVKGYFACNKFDDRKHVSVILFCKLLPVRDQVLCQNQPSWPVENAMHLSISECYVIWFLNESESN